MAESVLVAGPACTHARASVKGKPAVALMSAVQMPRNSGHLGGSRAGKCLTTFPSPGSPDTCPLGPARNLAAHLAHARQA